MYHVHVYVKHECVHVHGYTHVHVACMSIRTVHNNVESPENKHGDRTAGILCNSRASKRDIRCLGYITANSEGHRQWSRWPVVKIDAWNGGMEEGTLEEGTPNHVLPPLQHCYLIPYVHMNPLVLTCANSRCLNSIGANAFEQTKKNC